MAFSGFIVARGGESKWIVAQAPGIRAPRSPEKPRSLLRGRGSAYSDLVASSVYVSFAA